MLAAGMLVFASSRNFTGRERALAWAGLFAHVLSTFALVEVTRRVYGVGDLLSYMRLGHQLAHYAQLTGHYDHVLSIATGGDPRLPFWIVGAGTPTGNMSGMAALGYLFIGGDWAVNLAFAMFAFSGQLAVFLALRERVSRHMRLRVATACFLVPSAVFWTSGALKEAVAVGALGWLVWALSTFEQRKRIRGAAVGAPMALLTALTKAYLLFPLAASAAVYVLWQRRAADAGATRIRPARIVVAVIVCIVVIAGLGELFPQYALDNLGEEAARRQHYGGAVGGGSYYQMGDSTDRSFLGQLSFAPWALLSSLYRPFPFEITNAALAVNALESMSLLGLTVAMLVTQGWRKIWREVLTTPEWMFCLSMTILLGVGIGLTTTNVGTLSRYRVPMMPFFVALLLALHKGRSQVAANTATKAAGLR